MDLDAFWLLARKAYRQRAKTAHPDAGGTGPAMACLTDALAVVRQYVAREQRARGDVAYLRKWQPNMARRGRWPADLRKAR